MALQLTFQPGRLARAVIFAARHPPSAYENQIVLFPLSARLRAHASHKSLPNAQIFRPLLSALSFIHARGLIHRDLKPENILLGPNFEIKLSDFGLSINQHQEVANTRLGTLNYIAPEILQCPYKHHPLENKGFGSIGYDNMVRAAPLSSAVCFMRAPLIVVTCGGSAAQHLPQRQRHERPQRWNYCAHALRGGR